MTVVVENRLQQDVVVGYIDVGGVVVEVLVPYGAQVQWEGAIPATLDQRAQGVLIPRGYIRTQDWDRRTRYVPHPIRYIVVGSRARARGVAGVTGTLVAASGGSGVVAGTAHGVGASTGGPRVAMHARGSVTGGTTVTGTLVKGSAGGPPVTTGLALRYDASALVGLTDGQTVSTMPDLSGNSRAATLASGASVYKVAQLNGLPVVRMTAGDSYGLTCPQGAASIIFCVMKTTNPTAGFQGFMQRAYNNNGPGLYASGIGGGAYTTGIYWDGPGGTFQLGFTGVGSPNSGYKIAAWEWDGTDITLWEDGVSQATAAAKSNGDTWTSISLSSQQQWGGDLAELLIYNGDLSSGDRAAVYAYLSAKWGI